MRLRVFAFAVMILFGAIACTSNSNVPPTSASAPSAVATKAPGFGAILQRGASAAYVDAFATGAIGRITASGWATPTVLLIGFADPRTSAANSTIAGALSTAAGNRPASQGGNLTFVSIGGAGVSPSSWPQPAGTLAGNLIAQINGYNNSLTGNNQVVGVDLDLENGFAADTIANLAHALHGQPLSNGKTLLVSIAPQVVGVSGVNVDATQAVNLGFSPGGINNNYGTALKNNDVDYIFAQAYNSGPTVIVLNNVITTSGASVQGIDESNPLFFQGIGQAMNSVVRSVCTNATTLCIQVGTKVFVGMPANQGAGGTYTVFNPSAPQAPPISYDQATILSALSNELTYMKTTNPTPYSNISGVSMWALGNDYAPNLFTDNFAKAGAFSTAMFGASPAPAGASILLQLSNNGSTSSITTLIFNGSYYPFPAVAGSANATWCTQAATGTFGCTDSSILDTIGAATVTVQVTTNGTAWICPAAGGVGTGGTVTLVSGRYNLQVNGDFNSCAFGSF